MPKIKEALLFIVLVLTTQLSTASCPDLPKATIIAKELLASVKLDVCAKGINAEQFRWIKEQALPKLMNSAFLGVEPPKYWQLAADEFFQDCSPRGNLCTHSTQEELVQCFTAKLPTFMMVFGNWFADNCEAIDRALIQHWESKKPIVNELISNFPLSS